MLTASTVTIGRGAHPAAAAERFPRHTLGAFREPCLLRALHGKRWWSAYVEVDGEAMLHVLVPRPIGTTGYLDAEAWVGYGGPLLTTPDPQFVARAVAAYGVAAREQRLVAEIIRFDPATADDRPFRSVPGLDIVEANMIAYVPLRASDAEQARRYTAACRRRLRTGLESLEFARSDTDPAWAAFESLYAGSLSRSGAVARWRFGPGAFRRLRALPHTHIATVSSPAGDVVAAAMALRDGEVGHSLLVASGPVREHPGAGELLVHGIARTFLRDGCALLCLGGGGNAGPDDSLLRFKAKFTGGDLRPLPLGLVVHDPSAYEQLARGARARTPIDAVLGKVTRSFLPYRTTCGQADPEAIRRSVPSGADRGPRQA